MSIAAGARLGPYEILAPLGSGGMGEVYRARDTRLERTVAVKVLPAHLSSSAESRQRFEREAKTISQLSHPHICALYDVGNQEGVEFLVMEYLEGETLSDRLLKGALPFEQVLRYGIEIADALDKAHRQGIVHRDLKPGNIMLTKSGVKLLDFGLAKAMAPPAQQSSLTALPTQQGLTQEGTILGTFQYMAPEQLEGKEADARADIFAFGATLYEMATGKKAFSASSQASLITAIMSTDPAPISSVQPMSPPALDRVVRTCLAKDPEDRWQSAGDVAKELRWISEGSAAGLAAPAVVSSRRRLRERIAWVAAAAAAAAAIWLAVAGPRRPVVPRATIRAFVPQPRGTQFFFMGPGAGSLTLSPDGKFLTFAAMGADGLKLWLRPLDGTEARPIAGTEDGQYPFWSPDSRFIGFFGRGKLKKIAVSGGAAIDICDVTGDPRGGTWSRDGVILFEPHWREGLSRVSADGGVSQPVTRIDEKRRETTHRFPLFLPDGRHYLYLAGSHVAEDTSGENAIYLGELGSADRRLLLHVRSNVIYASGHLLYVRGRQLVAQKFDPKRLTLEGEATNVADGVRYERGFFQGVFSASETGILAFQRGEPVTLTRVRWFERSGKPGQYLTEPGEHFDAKLSPDEKTAAVSTGDPGDVWLYDLARGIRTRLTFDPMTDTGPVWSPDGKTIYYSSDRKIHWRIYRRSVSGAGQEEVMTTDTEPAAAWDMSPNGRFLVFERSASRARTNLDLWIMPLTGGGKATPFLAAPFSESQASFAPDGRWLAYTSDESGREEVYVTSFPGHEGKWQISSGGGTAPRWRRDGREIFYVAPDSRIHSVEVRPGEAFQAGAPRPLFATQIARMPWAFYDVTADGQRFLITELVGSEEPEPITLVVDWTAGLEKK
jgi:Tol biopolymer transport system component/predicted Ser/Thr protein kinase